MDDNHRYRPYHRSNRRYDDDCKHQYKKSWRYPSHQEHRNSNDTSYRRSYRNDYQYRPRHHQQQPIKSRSYPYFSSTTPQPLMSTTILPPPPPPPAPLVGPQERESWIRSVKKTNTNESAEQKTQYLETMLRMSQQKSLLKSSRFDRMRFADDQLDNPSTGAISTTTQDNLDQNSFHFIDDINNHQEICALEKILFDKDLQIPSTNQPVLESQQSCSGFLIDNCDEEEELPPYSPAPRPIMNDPIEQNPEDLNEGRVALVSELDAADAERRQELKRQKRLQRKLKKKQINSNRPTTSNTTQETALDEVARLSDEVHRASIAMNDEDRTEKVNLILTKIRKQQEELKKLKQYVLSMLGEDPSRTSSNSHRQKSHLTEDLFLALLNQTNCWLCSGKMYAEVATQCDDNEQ